MHQVDNLLGKIVALKKCRLTGVHVAASFLKQRVQPLQLCPTWGFEYSGMDDPSRMSPEDISDEEIGERLSHMFRSF